MIEKKLKIKVVNASASEAFSVGGITIPRGCNEVMELPMRAANHLVAALSNNKHVTFSAVADSVQDERGGYVDSGKLKGLQDEVVSLADNLHSFSVQNAEQATKISQLESDNADLMAKIAELEGKKAESGETENKAVTAKVATKKTTAKAQ